VAYGNVRIDRHGTHPQFGKLTTEVNMTTQTIEAELQELENKYW
jgi:hypothetical protein